MLSTSLLINKHTNIFISTALLAVLYSGGRFRNRTGTSFDDRKVRGKDYTRLPVLNLPLLHWSSQLFDLRAPSSTDVPILLLNQPIGAKRSASYRGYLFDLSRGIIININKPCLAHSVCPWCFTNLAFL